MSKSLKASLAHSEQVITSFQTAQGTPRCQRWVPFFKLQHRENEDIHTVKLFHYNPSLCRPRRSLYLPSNFLLWPTQGSLSHDRKWASGRLIKPRCSWTCPVEWNKKKRKLFLTAFLFYGSICLGHPRRRPSRLLVKPQSKPRGGFGL